MRQHGARGGAFLLAWAAFLAALATADSAPLRAQGAGTPIITPVPWGKGEFLEYSLKIGFVEAGSGRMQVVGLDTLRGRHVWRLRFNISGGVAWLGVRVNDSYDSYLDTETLNSLRFLQDLNEPGSKRLRIYDIYPEKQSYLEHGKGELPSVADPLDDASLFFHLRTIPLEVGKRYEIPRYFDPRANPVVIQVLRREHITVPAGSFDAIVLRPIIKTSGLFADGGQAEIWLSDDDRHLLLRMNVKLGSIASLSLNLRRMQNVMPPRTSGAADPTKRP